MATAPAAGRTIAFGVSGYIHVNKFNLHKSRISIAGQTAPGDGIGFRNGSFIINANNIVIRHARFRYGDQVAGGDCINPENRSRAAGTGCATANFGFQDYRLLVP